MPVELDEINVRGLALVIGWDPRPHIDWEPRHGCLVTGTVSHLAAKLSILRLVGDDEPIIATPWHRMYSHTRSDWVAIADLSADELLRTADGAIAIASVARLDGQHEPVFNLEVAGSHRYFVHGRRVLTHNTYGAARARGFPSFGAFKRAMGPAGKGMHWHHIVEQGGPRGPNVVRFGAARIHNTDNIIMLDAATHQKVSALYSRVRPGSQGQQPLRSGNGCASSRSRHSTSSGSRRSQT